MEGMKMVEMECTEYYAGPKRNFQTKEKEMGPSGYSNEHYSNCCSSEGSDVFWLVWKEGGGAPTTKHHSEQLAIEESKRLAARNPGTRFFVLKSRGVSTTAVATYRPV
jgi:hypothetical protein